MIPTPADLKGGVRVIQPGDRGVSRDRPGLFVMYIALKSVDVTICVRSLMGLGFLFPAPSFARVCEQRN